MVCNALKLLSQRGCSAQICVWSTGNAARPIVQAISAQIPEQAKTMEGRNPATTKLSVDPFLRIEGAMDAIALGDCSRMSGRPLPATAQARAHSCRLVLAGFCE